MVSMIVIHTDSAVDPSEDKIISSSINQNVFFPGSESHRSSYFHLSFSSLQVERLCTENSRVYKYRPQEASSARIFTCATALFPSPQLNHEHNRLSHGSCASVTCQSAPGTRAGGDMMLSSSSTQFKFSLFTRQILAKQLHRKVKFLVVAYQW